MKYKEMELDIVYRDELLTVSGRYYPEIKSGNILNPDERAEFNIDKIMLFQSNIDLFDNYNQEEYNEIEELCIDKIL